MKIHNVTSSHEKLFAVNITHHIFRMLYMDALGIQQYATNSILFLRIIPDNYIITIQGIDHPIAFICLSYKNTCKRIFTLLTPKKLQEI